LNGAFGSGVPVWEVLGMTSNFTLIELVVVILVIAVVATVGLPPVLTKVHGTAHSSSCRANLHHLGAAHLMHNEDHNGMWVGWVGQEAYQDAKGSETDYGKLGSYLGEPAEIPPQPWVEMKGGPMYQLYAAHYFEDISILDCRGMIANARERDLEYGYPHVKEPDWTSPNPKVANTYLNERRVITGSEYGYDLGRVDLKSDPGRVVMADLQEIGVWDKLTEGNCNIQINYEAAHDGGANVLFFDQAVLWTRKAAPEAKWTRDNLDDGSGKFTFPAYGYIPNPRLDEDMQYADNVNMDGSLGPAGLTSIREVLRSDMDDIYCIECDSSGLPWRYKEEKDSGWMGCLPGEQAGTLCPPHPSLTNTDPPAFGGPVSSEVHPRYSPWRPVMNWKGPYREGHWGGVEWGEKGNCDANWMYCYEQRGPYADEVRWSKHDARLIGGPPFFRGGGPGVPVGFDWRNIKEEDLL
jgi:prepilin-type processing-associated H-X9-DG protein